MQSWSLIAGSRMLRKFFIWLPITFKSISLGTSAVVTLKVILLLSFLVLDHKHDLECGLEGELGMKSERRRCEVLVGYLVWDFWAQKQCWGLFLAWTDAELLSRQLCFNTWSRSLIAVRLDLWTALLLDKAASGSSACKRVMIHNC